MSPTLEPGTRLGPYQIESKLGSGGMGEVYKARDTRLGRTVAIKVLPPSVAADAEARQRFTREAKAISSLNHPNICTLHDIGSENGTDFLVMEHLEGETFAERLTRGPFPLDEALTHAIAIADALDKAHRQGITHRDLKPGNVMLTATGAKLLDFGLAKLTRSTLPLSPGGGEGWGEGGSAPPTATSPLTGRGTILGTLQYMSPEQLQGKAVDARSDIFAFGALVYEMVTGRKAFQGESQASVIGAILEREPTAITELQPLTPQGLGRVLKKCLAKSPDRRWQSAGDLTDALRWLAEPASGETTVVEAARPFKPTSAAGRLGWAVVIFVVGLLAGVLATRAALPGTTDSANSPLTHATVPLGPDQQLVGGLLNASPLAISPDGAQVAYTVSDGTTLQLYIQRLDEFEARRIDQSEGANSPFFSPDGQWVGFFASGGLYKVSTGGGAPLKIADGPTVGAGAHWTPDDMIVYSDLNGLYRVPADGGTTESIYREQPSTIFSPHVLPGGERLLVSVSRLNFAREIISVVLDTGEASPVPGLDGVSWVHYRPTGHLFYGRGSDIWSSTFDPASVSLVGSPAAVLEEVDFLTSSRGSLAAISTSGVLVYAPRGPLNRLVWVDRRGEVEPLPAEPGRHRLPRLDPGGGRVLVATSTRVSESELRLLDFERGGVTRLSGGDFAVWSADGRSVTASGIDGLRLSQIPVGSPSNLTHLVDTGSNVPGDWSADSRFHAFYKIETDTNRDLWVLSSDGDAQSFLVTPANERTPYFSPDGRWIAYVSDESGRDEVYVRNYPGGEQRATISNDGGREPIWSPDGSEIFYRNGRQMLVVEVTGENGFKASTPRVLFEGRFAFESTGLPNYDVAPDGQRFLMLTDSSPTELRVIENFGEMVEERLRDAR